MIMWPQDTLEDGKHMNWYQESSGGQEYQPLLRVMWTDVPHVKLPKYDQETGYPCNQIKYPQKYGRRSLWTSSQTSQYLKDMIHYSL
jgi:hypothetical protein